MKYNKCTFTALLMTRRTREHKETIRPIHMQMPTWSTIADDTAMDDMNLSAVHVICNQCIFLSNQENQIPF